MRCLIKRIASIIMTILIELTMIINIVPTYVYATDIGAPEINVQSLKVDKKQVKIGDSVKVSIRITDETEIKHVFMFYQRPQTKNTESMVLKYNNITGYYEGEIEIKETSESGIWKISWIKAEDIYDNQIEIHNSNVYDFYEEKADLSAGDFEVEGTEADIHAPVIDIESLKVSKNQAGTGDKVKISIRITDETEIKHVFMFYQRPQTKNTESMVLKYNNITGYYEGEIEIKETSESGIWKISWIKAEDIYDNQIEIHNSNVYDFYEEKADLSAGDFEVEGTEADIHAPVIDIESLKVSKNQAGTGDKVKISIRITDETEIKHVFMFYQRPQTKNTESMVLKYNNITGYYEGEIEIKETSESGIWKISWIKAEDIYDNQIEIHNSNVYDFYEEKADLSAGNIEVYVDSRYESITPMQDITVYSESTVVSNTVINGDVYIGSEAVVSLLNVIVTGDIYVLGGLKVVNISAKSLYGRYVSYGQISLYRNGEVCISGNNTFSGTVLFDTKFLPDIPVRIDKAINSEGKLYMTGVAANIADMYISGIKINVLNNGKFLIDGIDIQNQEYIIIKWIMYDGSVKEEKIALSDKDGNIPILDVELSQTHVVIKEGEFFKLTTNIFPDNTTLSKSITWDSNNTLVAEVDSDGKILAKKAGEAIVTATSVNEKYATCRVTVVLPYIKANIYKNVYQLHSYYDDLGMEINILDSSGEIMCDNQTIKTGCILQYKEDNKVLNTSSIVVKGDIDGTGTIDVLDMEAIQKSILGIGDKLSGAYKEAASLSGGEDITVLDMEVIQKDILGIEKIN